MVLPDMQHPVWDKNSAFTDDFDGFARRSTRLDNAYQCYGCCKVDFILCLISHNSTSNLHIAVKAAAFRLAVGSFEKEFR
jgi:hypothetical protein